MADFVVLPKSYLPERPPAGRPAPSYVEAVKDTLRTDTVVKLSSNGTTMARLRASVLTNRTLKKFGVVRTRHAGSDLYVWMEPKA